MLDSLRKLYYLVKHSVTGCHEDDLKYINKSYATCIKCGRKIFIFRSY